MNEESVKNILQNIEESVLQSSFYPYGKIPPMKGAGYALPVGITAYRLSFLEFFPEEKKLLLYDFDEKGGIGPDTTVYKVTKEDLQMLDEVDDWPDFITNYFVRIKEAPYRDHILEKEIKNNDS